MLKKLKIPLFSAFVILIAVIGWFWAARDASFEIDPSEVPVVLTDVQKAKIQERCEKTLLAGTNESADIPLAENVASKASGVKSAITPFHEIGRSLGRWGESNQIIYPVGVTVFDANGDGRLDLYMPEFGRLIGRAMSKEGVISTTQPIKSHPSTLMLNQGNDEQGNPVYNSVQDLIAKQEDFNCAGKELAIEDSFRPRNHTYPVGGHELTSRQNNGAVAADFNGDGKLDLYIVNGHYGQNAQSDETAFRLYPLADNIGRDANDNEAYLIKVPSFMAAGEEDGLTVTLSLGEKEEREGRNTLLLNLGDLDLDGIPEWQDVTEAANVGGHWDSVGVTVADIDRDGDIDIYVANFLDADFHGFSMSRFAGNRNQLYLNQLAETGELTFKESALDYGVAGLHKEEGLPSSVYFDRLGGSVEIGEQRVGGKLVGEVADHSWAAQLVDWNDDLWPDLIVANDVGNRLRVYKNIQGQSFERIKTYDEEYWNGCWMGIQTADLDGDLSDEVLVTSCGSQFISLRYVAMTFKQNGDPTEALGSISGSNAKDNKSHLSHAFMSFSDGVLKEKTSATKIEHSVIPPDMTNVNNVIPQLRHVYHRDNMGSSITGLEFAWGPVFFDVENDGDLDIYLAGALARGNDGGAGDQLGGPGRLLINESVVNEFNFRDKTIDYRVLDIDLMDYDHVPPRRPSPGTGWHKRDYVTVEDMDAISGVGLYASETSQIHDIFRMHEAAVGMVSADLNNDGYADLLVRHKAGYDSLSPNAKNMKIKVGPLTMAVPAPNKIVKPPRSLEAGRTFLYINGGVADEDKAHWVKLRLLDIESNNHYAVGAKVIVNGSIMRRYTVGGISFSSYAGDMLIGLGKEPLKDLEVVWPSGNQKDARQIISLESPVSRETLCVDRKMGVVDCKRAHK